MFKYMLIPFVLFISSQRLVQAQELHAVANRFSQEMNTLGLAIAVGALAIVGIGMMLGKKDSAIMTTQAIGGILVLVLSSGIVSFIRVIAG